MLHSLMPEIIIFKIKHTLTCEPYNCKDFTCYESRER